jgi:hypothetical protein
LLLLLLVPLLLVPLLLVPLLLVPLRLRLLLLLPLLRLWRQDSGSPFACLPSFLGAPAVALVTAPRL